MNGQHPFELKVRDWLLADAPPSAPAGLVEDALLRVTSVAQQSSVERRIADIGSMRTVRLALAVSLLALLVVAGVAFVGSLRNDPPAVLPQGATPVTGCELLRGGLLESLAPGIRLDDYGVLGPTMPVMGGGTTTVETRSLCHLWVGDEDWIGNFRVSAVPFPPFLAEQPNATIRGIPVSIRACESEGSTSSSSASSSRRYDCAMFDIDGGAWHYVFWIRGGESLADVDVPDVLHRLAAQVIDRLDSPVDATQK